MKKKIVGIFVCMLLIATIVLPVRGTINKYEDQTYYSQYLVDNDMELTSINSPSSGPAGVITPNITVTNLGSEYETASVNITIERILSGGGTVIDYSQTIVADFNSYESKFIYFPTWTPYGWQVVENVDIDYLVWSCVTLITGTDPNPSNNCGSNEITLHYGYFHDVGVTEIISPYNGPVQSYPVKVIVKNFGAFSENNVPVEAAIEEFITDPNNGTLIYLQTTYIGSISPGESKNVILPDCYISEIGKYEVTACTQLDIDENPGNDCLTEKVYIGIEFMGFEVAPLGLADLAINDDILNVYNCNSGQPETDGVWINLEDKGNSFNASMKYFDLNNSGNNRTLTFTTFVIEPIPNLNKPGEPVPGAEIFIEQEPNDEPIMNIEMERHYEPTSKAAVRAFNEQNIVFYKENIPTDDGRLYIGNFNGQCEYLGYGCGNQLSSECTFSSPVLWNWPEQGVSNILVNRVEFIPDNLSQPITACSYSTIYTNNNPAFDITWLNAGVNIFGFNHIPLGNAVLEVVDNTLVVSNIGTSGNDGVQVILPEGIVNFKPKIEFESPSPQSISLDIVSKGIVDGVQNQVATITSYSFMDGGTNMSMTYDASALKPEYLWAHYYINGSPMPVLSEEIPIGGNRTNPLWTATVGASVTGINGKVGSIIPDFTVSETSNSGPFSQSLSNMEDNGICGGFDLGGGGKGNFITQNSPEVPVVEADSIWVYTQYCEHELQTYSDVLLKVKAINPASISIIITDEKALYNDSKIESPEINGQVKGKILTEYDYTATTTDPQGGELYYWFYWGDQTSSGWLGPYTSGDDALASHAWEKKGTCLMGAIAKNIDGFYSEGFGVLEVKMPRTCTAFILSLLERFQHAFPILRHLMGL